MIQPVEQRLERLAVQRAVRAVETFKPLKKQQQSFQVPAFELVILPVDRMGHRVRDLVLLDVLGHIVNVPGAGLKRFVDRRVDPVDQHVKLAMILGKPAAQLFADNDVGSIGDLKRPLDRVVIGERDEIHLPLLCLPVDFDRAAVTFGTVDGVEDRFAGLVAGIAVAMQVNALGPGVHGHASKIVACVFTLEGNSATRMTAKRR